MKGTLTVHPDVLAGGYELKGRKKNAMSIILKRNDLSIFYFT